MAKESSSPSAGLFVLDRDSRVPLYEQLCRQLRDAILSGNLPPGTRLPASRVLANEMDLSRTTIVNAYQQLAAEGYLHSQIGSGTFVAATIPEEYLYVQDSTAHSQEVPPAADEILRDRDVASSHVFTEHEPPRPFQPGAAGVDSFPMDLWKNSVRKAWSRMTPSELAYGPSAGYPPLQEAIAGHLSVARGVHCDPEQVLITHGSQQGLSLTAQLLLETGDQVWMEEPGHIGARAALRLGGSELIRVPIDEEGLDVEAGAKAAPEPRLIFVTPSHQFPMGVTMSLPRRLALLEYAERHGAWILEDDYDSEFRYSSRPIPALQGLAQTQRVIYMGTFSKSLFPGLRIGYLVLPEPLLKPYVVQRSVADRCPSVIQQAIVTDFMVEGHYTRHIRRMRLLYKKRQDTLLSELRSHLSEYIEVQASDAGLHLVAWLDDGISASEAAAELAKVEVFVNPVSLYETEPSGREGLVLGYGSAPAEQIPAAVRKIKAVLEELKSQ